MTMGHMAFYDMMGELPKSTAVTVVNHHFLIQIAIYGYFPLFQVH
jgi:hypothetical protein